MTTRLRVRDLEIGYGDVTVVHGVDLDLDAGVGHAVVGPSGSGKTTVARAVAGLVAARAGSIVVGDRELRGASGRSWRHVRREVGIEMVFQEPQTSLDPRWRIGRSVAEALPGRARAGRVRAVAELLDRVGLPAGAAARYPHELSVGQQQRVAIARAVASRPAVLVCDEPVAALDPHTRAQVLDLLASLLRERQVAVLLVTHDLASAGRVCDTASVLDAGRVVESGPLARIIGAPAHPRAIALVDAARRIHLGTIRT